MKKKIGLFWLRDDFRFTKNHGLIEATTNHDQVVVFYLYKKDTYKDQEAQKWWLSRSLFNFSKYCRYWYFSFRNSNSSIDRIRNDRGHENFTTIVYFK